MVMSSKSSLSDQARAVGQRIKGLRDFLELLEENGQLARWTDPVMPEPDIRNISVADCRSSSSSLTNNGTTSSTQAAPILISARETVAITMILKNAPK